MKLGQSPAMQLSSWLHEVWWMAVLRPHSVSIGITDRQLLLAPQSPQPSHTRSAIIVRRSACGARPRLRFRRNSAAHSWSCTSTVTPGTPASSSCASTILLRSHTSTPAGRSIRRYWAVFSVVTMMRATPSSSSRRITVATSLPPTGACPPVIATARFHSSL